MAIDNTEVKAVAHLARLTINESDIAATTSTIGKILELVDSMRAIDTSQIGPMAHPLDATQLLRKDEVTESNQREQLQHCSPATEKGLFLVPRVIE